MRVLLLDNYDSFTFNLVHALEMAGLEVRVILNDRVSPADLAGTRGMVLSPGPGSPSQAGRLLEMVRSSAGRLPMLGVCLGHQAIAEAFGGRVVRAPQQIHGKASRISHDARGVFSGLGQGLEVGRYHSLVVERDSLPGVLEISATLETGEIMGLRHRKLPIEGVQFHPESILTPQGQKLIENWAAMLR